MTPEQEKRAISILLSIDEGCVFYMSPWFDANTCGNDPSNGECFRCQTRKLLKELGVEHPKPPKSEVKPVITYYKRGDIERLRSSGKATWYAGYSANGERGGALQPWMTKTECRKDAAKQGALARFVEKVT